MSELTREQIETIKSISEEMDNIANSLSIRCDTLSALCDLALSAADAEQRGFTEAIEKAAEVAEKMSKAIAVNSVNSGSQYFFDLGSFAHVRANEIVAAIRALSPDDGTVRVPHEATEAMLEAALDATGERILPFAAEREGGVPVECDISKEDALAINEGTKAAFAEIYRAMIAEVK